MDFVSNLDSDMSIAILSCLDDPSDLVRASAVSRSWRHFVIKHSLSKNFCFKLFHQLTSVDRVIESGNEESSSETGSSSSLIEDTTRLLEREHRVFALLAKGCTSSPIKSCIDNAIIASSTDNSPAESIFNTLDERDIGGTPSYWSSTGHHKTSVSETLLYQLKGDLCVITELNIQPFQAYFHPGTPIYSSHYVRFRFGHLDNHSQDENNYVWTYTSQQFAMAQENRLQSFKLPEPVLCIVMVQEFKKNHKNSHLFKIDSFSLLTKYEIDCIESSVFDLCGRKWKIIVNYDEDEEHASIYLENQDPVDVELEYQVYVVSQLKAIWYPNINVKYEFSASTKTISKGITNLMSLDGLKGKGFLIGDCCMFGATLPDQETERPGTAECFSLIEKPLNNKVTWMMTKFSSFDPAKAHHSNAFVVGNRKWRIEVHPRGCEEEKNKSLSVFLVGEGFINNAPKTETYAKFKLRVLDQVNRNHIEKTASNWVEEEYDDDNGFTEFMPLSKLCEPYLVKDKLYVGVEFEVISVTNYV